MAKTAPAPGTANVAGLLSYNGQPYFRVSTVKPEFTTTIGSPLHFTYDPTTSEFILPNVPPGSHYFEVRVYVQQYNIGVLAPGDLYMYGRIEVKENKNQTLIQRNILLAKMIHLTKPFNNKLENPDDGETQFPLFSSGDLSFQWESVPEACEYAVVINRYTNNPYTLLEEVVNEKTNGSTAFLANLSPSLEQQYYGFKVFAYNKNNVCVGILIINYPEYSYGWDYRFRIN
jgi:hypothetical protein